MTQDPADTSLSDVISVETASETIETTLISVWNGFLEHLPFLLVGLGLLVFTAVISLVVRSIARKVLKRTGMQDSLKELLARLLYLATWFLGLLVVAMVVFPGLSPTRALGGLGVVGVAVGFAFQDIFENFFAGVLMLWRFPFDNGDHIECEDVAGFVEEITIRNTMIRRTSGELLVVPNSKLFKNPVEVHTNRSTRRLTLMTGVSYDTDVEAATQVIEKSVASCSSVDQDQPVQVFPQAFGASSVDIEVTWWSGSKPVEQRQSLAEVVTSVKRALDSAGIEIPFPYRTLTFKEPLALKGRLESVPESV